MSPNTVRRYWDFIWADEEFVRRFISRWIPQLPPRDVLDEVLASLHYDKAYLLKMHEEAKRQVGNHPLVKDISVDRRVEDPQVFRQRVKRLVNIFREIYGLGNT